VTVMRGADRVVLADSLLMAHSGLVSREGNFSTVARELAAAMGTTAASGPVDTVPERESATVDAITIRDFREVRRGKTATSMRLLRRVSTRLDLKQVWQRFKRAIAPLKSDWLTQDLIFGESMTPQGVSQAPRGTNAHSGLWSPPGVSDRIGPTGGLE
jgi:hypothetical protein